MTLYELIDKANSVLTPQSRAFYDYVMWTSDDNGGFLRTCYRKKSKPLKDRNVRNVAYILIGFSDEFDENLLTTHFEDLFGDVTHTKLQFFYDITDLEALKAEKELSQQLDFGNFVEIKL